MATEEKATGNEVQSAELLRPDPIRPEPNRLDGALRASALFLMLLGSCFIVNHVGRASTDTDEVFLEYALFLFGASLLFMSVMLGRSRLAARFAALVVISIQNFIFGNS